ncbi:MAG: tRNA pseudouridine(55) synthase TruB [Ferruginibacter sp.]|nr:tRNA pseudouridine(55) synthase TruB [Ferruginibacter sp.]
MEATHKPVQQFVNISEEKKAAFEEGKVLLIDKPLHWTSFDVVRKIRGSIRIKKVGHAGTLDPLATGLLIICTGKFTKQINDFMAKEKEYTGTFTLGFTTPTYDLESTPQNPKDISLITEQMLHDATKPFIGEIMQMPPIYSAIKKDGVALYELARRGEDVDLKARPIIIHQFEITKIELPIVHFKILCGTGTYIRSMAHDYGAVLGCGAYLSSLRRTKIGEFDVEKAMGVEEFMNTLVSNE